MSLTAAQGLVFSVCLRVLCVYMCLCLWCRHSSDVDPSSSSLPHRCRHCTADDGVTGAALKVGHFTSLRNRAMLHVIMTQQVY